MWRALSGPEVLFLKEPRHGVLTTCSSSGALHAVPVNCVLPQEPEPTSIYILSSQTSKKVRQIAAGSQGSFCVFDGARYVSVSGHATIVTEGDAVQSIVALYAKKYAKTVRANPERVVVVLHVEQVVSRGFAG